MFNTLVAWVSCIWVSRAGITLPDLAEFMLLYDADDAWHPGL
jgi:hypothetical protein